MKKVLSLFILAMLLCLPQVSMAQYPAYDLYFNTELPAPMVYIGVPFDATAYLNNPDNLPVRWESGNTEAFTVDQNGIITPISSTVYENLYLYVHFDGNQYYLPKTDSLYIAIFSPISFSTYLGEDTWDDVEVTYANAADIFGDGKASFDFQTFTLTLDNCQMGNTSVSFNLWDSLIVFNLIGDNTINTLLGGRQLFTGSGSLTISLTGRLYSNQSAEIVSAQSMTVDGASVTIYRSVTGGSPFGMYSFITDTLTIRNNGHFKATIADYTEEEGWAPLGEYAHVGFVNHALVMDANIGYLGNFGEKWIPDVSAEKVYSVWQREEFNGAFFFKTADTHSLLRGTLEIGSISSSIHVLPDLTMTEIRMDGLSNNYGLMAVTLGENDEFVGAGKQDGYLALNTPVSLSPEQISYVLTTAKPDDDTYKSQLPGISIILPASGSGKILVDADVNGSPLNGIQAGNDHPSFSVEYTGGRDVMEINYETYESQDPVVFHLYMASEFGSAPRRAKVSSGDENVKIYGITIVPNAAISMEWNPYDASSLYTTFYHSTQRYRLDNGVEAYVAQMDGTNLVLTKIAEGGQVIPNDVAFILKSAWNPAILIPTNETALEITAQNDLLGVDEQTEAPANSYVLATHSADYSVTGAGFYPAEELLAAHKAYIVLTDAGEAPANLNITFAGTPTGVNQIVNSTPSVGKRMQNGQLLILRNGVRYNALGQPAR